VQSQPILSTMPQLPYLDEAHRSFVVCRSASIFSELTIESDDGTPLSVFRAGHTQLPVILLVNALGISCLFLAQMAQRLATNYHVITWESRGLPDERHTARDADLSIERHCRDAATILAHQGIGCDGIVAYCSGSNAAVYGLTKGILRSRALCIVSPSMRLGQETQQTTYQRTMLPLWETVARSGPRHAALIRALLEQGRKQVDSGSVDWELECLNNLPFRSNESIYRYARLQAECLRHEWSQYLPRIQAPVLVLHGEQDDKIHRDSAAAVAQAAGSAAFRTFPTGHFGIYTSSALHEAVAEFLGKSIAPPRQ
jgi:pimeloyl-ACP methyl ester carboxylesterase